jgi:hypothetical protein
MVAEAVEELTRLKTMLDVTKEYSISRYLARVQSCRKTFVDQFQRPELAHHMATVVWPEIQFEAEHTQLEDPPSGAHHLPDKMDEGIADVIFAGIPRPIAVQMAKLSRPQNLLSFGARLLALIREVWNTLRLAIRRWRGQAPLHDPIMERLDIVPLLVDLMRKGVRRTQPIQGALQLLEQFRVAKNLVTKTKDFMEFNPQAAVFIEWTAMLITTIFNATLEEGVKRLSLAFAIIIPCLEAVAAWFTQKNVNFPRDLFVRTVLHVILALLPFPVAVALHVLHNLLVEHGVYEWAQRWLQETYHAFFHIRETEEVDYVEATEPEGANTLLERLTPETVFFRYPPGPWADVKNLDAAELDAKKAPRKGTVLLPVERFYGLASRSPIATIQAIHVRALTAPEFEATSHFEDPDPIWDIREVGVIPPLSEDEYRQYLTKFPAWKLRKYEAAWEEQDSNPESTYPARVMSKGDEKLRRRVVERSWDDDDPMDLKIRLIVMHPYRHVMDLARFTIPYVKAIIARADELELRPREEEAWQIPWRVYHNGEETFAYQRVYAYDLTQNQKSEIMNAFIDQSKKYTHVLLDSYMSDDGTGFYRGFTPEGSRALGGIESDLVQCDASTRKPAQKYHIGKMRKAGLDEETCRIRKKMTTGVRKARVRTSEGTMEIKYSQDEPATPSGVPDTCETGGTIHASIKESSLLRLIKLFRQGELNTDTLISTMTKTYNDHGYSVGTLKFAPLDTVRFLGGWWSKGVRNMPGRASWIWHPITPGKLTFIGSNVKEVFPGRTLLVAKQMLYHSMAKGCKEFEAEPVGAALLKYYRRVGSYLSVRDQAVAEAMSSRWRGYLVKDHLQRSRPLRDVIDEAAYVAKIETFLSMQGHVGDFHEALCQWQSSLESLGAILPGDSTIDSEALRLLDCCRY